MTEAPPGLQITETRHEGPVRIVFSARQMPLDRPVQLIGLAPGVLLSSPLARAFLQEASVLAKLDHPNIVRLFDLKRSESQLWLILEEVDGPRLTDVAGTELTWQAAAAVGLDLARALVHAHTVGETHGRLHLEAVQLTRSGRTKLSNFGQDPISQGDHVEALEPHNPGGLSPEGTIGHASGPLSDIFAWGALMYELLSGEAPFGDPNDTHYASRVRNDRPTPLLLKRPDLPPALDHVISRCLEKLPSERPAHSAEIAEILEALIGSSTVPILRAELSRLGFSLSGSEEGAALPPATSKETGGRGAAHLRRFTLPVLATVLGAGLAGLGVYAAMKERPKGDDEALPDRHLPTEDALLLRVVASPWAHVVVDGKHRETTPFAQPITLEPGRHIVRLEHPHAAPEERMIDGRAGQAVLLNVQLHVERPLSLDSPIEAPEETSP